MHYVMLQLIPICKLLIYMIFSIFITSPAFATFSWYESWETYTTNTDYDSTPNDSDAPTEFEFDVFYVSAANAFNKVYSTEEGFTARYGDKYYKSGVTIDDCNTIYADGYKVYSILNGPQLDANKNLNRDDGTEYWVGYSMWIPSDYYQERYNSDQLAMSNDNNYGEGGSGCPNVSIWKIVGYGGSSGAGYPAEEWYTRTRYWGECAGYAAVSWEIPWTDHRGTWVDFVEQFVLYSSDNVNARMKTFMNGVEIDSRPEGGANVPARSDPFLQFVQYNHGHAYCEGLTAAECAAGDGDPYVFQCSTDYVDPFVTFERALWIDEFRIMEASVVDTNTYCSVAPPIWSSAPTITNPTQNETDISTTETVTYGAYVDHRTDIQTCFARTSTTVQIDEQGGNWSSLVYENTSAGATSQAVSGLSENTSYQMRVMHKSLRSGTSDTYDGVWSATRDFYTGAPPEPVSTGVFSPLGQGGFGAGYGRMQ